MLSGLFLGHDVRSFYEEAFIRPTRNYFLVVIFGFDGPEQQEQAFDPANLLEVVHQGFIGGLLRTGFRTWADLVNLERPEDKGEILARISEIQRIAMDIHHSELSIGISSIVTRATEIKRAYEEAAEAIRYRMFYGRGSRIDIESLDPRQSQIHNFSIMMDRPLFPGSETKHENHLSTFFHRMVRDKAKSTTRAHERLLHIPGFLHREGSS
jgi:hypothetical protein